jgi:hypothetical protein
MGKSYVLKKERITIAPRTITKRKENQGEKKTKVFFSELSYKKKTPKGVLFL